jgi:hypothetical protein
VKYDEALAVVELLCNAFPGDRAWTAEEIRQYAKGIETLDAAVATRAVLRAQQEMTRRPPVHELVALYRVERANMLAQEKGVTPPDTKPQRLPLWVGRWACSRFFYARFGRDQDTRRFPEQGDWVDPAEPLMPPEEWEKEARSLKGRDVYRILGS